MIYKLKLILIVLIFLGISNCQFSNPGCSKYSNSICIQCIDRFYLQYGLCMPVNPVCFNYDNNNGNCLSCYEGFVLNGATCSLIPIPNCLVNSIFNGCVQCQQGYILYDKRCYKNVLNCQKYNNISRLCQTCNAGYQKLNQQCKIIPISNCINQIETLCFDCHQNYILNDNMCIQKDPQCLLYDNIICQTCSQSYQLVNNKCLPTIQFCETYDLLRNCIKCQTGFKLQNKQCIQTDDIEPFQQFCKQFDESFKCIKCSQGYFINHENRCIQIDQYCKIFNYSINVCDQCYTGYVVEGNQCVISLEKLDPNCNIFNKNKCIKCSTGYRFDISGVCVEVDRQCKVFDDKFQCLECYSGYMINATDGVCIISSNKYCLSWSKGGCIRCTPDSYLFNGTCALIDLYCSKFNFTTNKCISCYLGYVLNNDQTKCVILPPISTSTSTKNNCAQYNNDNICIKCYFSYFLKNGQCLLVDALCKTSNPLNGFCTSCYGGYFLMKSTGKCKRY